MKILHATSLAAALSLGSLCAMAANPNSTPTANTDPASAPSEQPGTDAWITTKVKTELMTTKGVPSTDISVTTNNGIVTLTGVVDTKAQVNKAIACAKGIKGVAKVDSSALTSRN